MVILHHGLGSYLGESNEKPALFRRVETDELNCFNGRWENRIITANNVNGPSQPECIK